MALGGSVAVSIGEKMAEVRCLLVLVGVPADNLTCFHKHGYHPKVKQDGGGQKFVKVSISSFASFFSG